MIKIRIYHMRLNASNYKLCIELCECVCVFIKHLLVEFEYNEKASSGSSSTISSSSSSNSSNNPFHVVDSNFRVQVK